MKRILTLLLLLTVLATVLCFPSFAEAPTVFAHHEITFDAYTAGAESAFDESNTTAYAGSITGHFAKRTVLSGVSVRAGSQIRNLTVSGSTDGIHWIPLYTAEKIATVRIWGSMTGTPSGTQFHDLYTYAFSYLRFEMTYGSIADITLWGYETELASDEQLAGFDTAFGYGGYTHSGSYYGNNERAKELLTHCIGGGDQGDVLTYSDPINKFAYLTVKFEKAERLTAIAFAHKSGDKNDVRWNGVKFEISSDGENWTAVCTLSADFNKQSNLKNGNLVLIRPEAAMECTYVRVSSTAGSISIGALDLYVQGQAATVPSDILNTWTGNPYTGEKAPAESEQTKERIDAEIPTKEQQTNAVTDAPAPSGSGCGSRISGLPLLLLTAGILLPVGLKKRFKKQ